MEIKLVHCTNQYWEFVRELRNNDEVQDGFISTEYISEKMQEIYMSKYSDCYRIALADKKPAGYVGVIENDIRICTHPNFQGKGIGKFMLKQASLIWPKAVAKVKITNQASLKLFQSCGFKPTYILLTQNKE